MTSSWDEDRLWEATRTTELAATGPWSDSASAPGPTGSDSGPARPPVPLLLAALGCVLAAGVISLFASGRPVVAVAAWLLAGFVCVGLLTMYAMSDAQRRANPWYVRQPWTSGVSWLIAVLAVVTVTWSALCFALWAGRR